MPEKVLLATDGSKDAALAARAAADVCEESGARLHVVHVWFNLPTARLRPFMRAELKKRGDELLGEGVKRVEDSGGHVTEAHLIEGRAADEILDLAGRIGADLLVIGSRGLGPVGRIALGSVSEGVVYRSARPVLVARGGGEAWPPQRVVIGDDGSDQSRRAGELASELGHLFGATTILVRATESAARPRGLPESEESLYERLLGEARAKDEEELEQRANELACATGTPVESRLAEGDGATAILKACEEDPATIAAVGARGGGLVRRALLGGVSTKVLRAASGPVLVHATPPESSGIRGRAARG
jgi:nucleotide-binding universal stress UspA family protein